MAISWLIILYFNMHFANLIWFSNIFSKSNLETLERLYKGKN